MSTKFVGVDISKKDFHLDMMHGKKHKRKVFHNSANGFQKMKKFLENCRVSEPFICMEATGTYYEDLAFFCVEQGYQVSVVNPALIKSFAKSLNKRNKTDRDDAEVIRLYAERMEPRLWEPPSEHVRTMRRLVRRIETITKMKAEEENRRKNPGLEPLEVESLKKVIDSLEEELKRLKKELDDFIGGDKELEEQRNLLESIPAVGPWSAARLMAALPELTHFAGVKQLVAFAGLTPTVHESGTSVKKSDRLSKLGSRRLRAALSMPTLGGFKCNEVIKSFADRLRSRPGKAKRGVMGACMRKLLHIVYGILKNRTPFNADIAMGRA